MIQKVSGIMPCKIEYRANIIPDIAGKFGVMSDMALLNMGEIRSEEES